MFSDGRAPAPGEQRGFKPHAPHFIPWLRGSLKPHNGGDLGLNRPYKSGPEARGSLTPLERAKGMGFFSIQGKDRTRKGELRCNGVGVARMLPVVLRGHHILPGGLGKQRADGPESDPGTRLGPGDGGGTQGPGSVCTSAQNNHTSVRKHLSLPHAQSDATSASARKYGPPAGPPPAPGPVAPAEELECKVAAAAESRRGPAWEYRSHTLRQRDLRTSSWLSSEAQGLGGRRDGSSSCGVSGGSQSHRDLTALRDPPAERFNCVVFSTDVPQRAPRGPGKPRPSSELIPGQNQTWVQHRPTDAEVESRRKDAACHRKVVRNQIKRVVHNLEQVLAALRDVHQEMKEVVQQIDHLTSVIDLNEEEAGSSGSDSSSGEVTVPGPTHPSGVLHSPPRMLRCPSERTRTPRFAYADNLPPSVKPGSPPQLTLTAHALTSSPQRSLPVRPPTPGLSPLTVSLHPSSSPASQPRSPGHCSSIRVSPVSPPSPVSPKPHPHPAISPSVAIDTKVRSYQTPQSDRPPAGGPPTDPEAQPESPARPVQVSAPPATARPPQGRRGRKPPPPYPHHKLPHEPREAPPYPEKRRLLSTTV